MKRKIKLDATCLRQSACLRRLFLLSVVGYKEPKMSISIEFGSAFHIFEENYILEGYTQEGFLKALGMALKYLNETPYTIEPKKEYLNASYLVQACESYRENSDTRFKILMVDGKPLVEQTFSILVYEDEETMVFLEGTIDKLGEIGCVIVDDRKTSSSWNPEKYFKPYRLDPQLLTYVSALYWLGEHYPSTIFGELAKKRIGARISAVFTSASKPPEFRSSEVIFFRDAEREEYWRKVKSLAQTLAQIKGNLPDREGMVNGACKTGYGDNVCQFFGACSAPDEIATQMILERDFVVKPYEPLGFRK